MTLYPTQLNKTEDRHIEIVWSDDFRQRTPFRQLRDCCPCASCRQPEQEPSSATSGLRVLSQAETIPLDITSMSPVGNYAYNIHFSDGHNTGIYTFELLRALGNS